MICETVRAPSQLQASGQLKISYKGVAIFMNRQNEKLYKVVITGLMAALCYVAFTFLKIPIPTFGGDMTALHIGNAFCVLAALLLGGWYGGLAGFFGYDHCRYSGSGLYHQCTKDLYLKALHRF